MNIENSRNTAAAALPAMTFSATVLTMSSREIAELVEARHNDVVETIERQFEKGVLRESRKTTRTYAPPGGGRPTEVYDLTKRDTLVVVSGYDDALRAKIIDRWMEIEASSASPQPLPDFGNPAAAARAWAEQYEARVLAERTKAEIGTRREATAMNTASQAVKRADKLAIELDRSREYATVKRMQLLYHGQQFSWRMLKHISTEMELPPIDVFDANYGTVKAYHADVWREAYALEIPAPSREAEQ